MNQKFLYLLHMSEKSSTFAAMFAKGRYIGWLFGALCLIGQGCSSGAVQEAEHVVAQADSMRAEGGMYNDSVQLAKAYHTLHRQKAFYPDEYARCCYHYGRLLREKDNPVAAMQVFINATHSRTREYYILGRVYNNMGDIAHLAGEFQLSYNMFERSAKMFLLSGDTTAYYYILNDMAFELAEQGKEKETLCILQTIKDYGDPNLEKFTYLTQAKLYLANEQYDSLLLICNKSLCDFSINYVFKARAFEYIGEVDSALYYAQKVMTLPDASEQDKYNMLYILTHYNTDITNEQLLEKTSERADIGIYMDNFHSRHAQASEVLRQSLQQKLYHKPIVILVVVVIIGIFLTLGIIIFVNHKKKEIQKETISEQQKQEQLINQQRILQTKNDLLSEQNTKLIEQQNRQFINRLQQVQANCELLYQSDDVLATIHWNDYRKMCEFINRHFFLLADKLKATKNLSEKEIRLCVLVLVSSFSDKQIADILYYSYKTIRSTKRHIALKLGTTSANLRAYLIKNAIE